LPPSNPGEQVPKTPARVSAVPIEAVPPLPWSPRLAYDVSREPFWVIFALLVVVRVVTLVEDDHHGWLDWVQGPVTVMLLWYELGRAIERLTVHDDALVLRGQVLRRRYSWKAVDGVERRGQKKVTVDLGHRGKRTFKYDGENGRPSADQVAGVIERKRGYNTSALTSYRVSLSWGAAVFLPAVAAVVAATAWALIKG
jgi:hypothetical protein